MKKITFFLILIFLVTSSCIKDSESERFRLLTTPVWTTVTLLANGADASGPGGMLEKFVGDAKFNKDGTGYFGDYTGQWWLNTAETEITIKPDTEVYAILCSIVQLTNTNFEITTTFPNPVNPQQTVPIQITFRIK